MTEELDRWKENDWSNVYTCPICRQNIEFGKYYRYCPNCGTRLYPPRKNLNPYSKGNKYDGGST